MTEPLACPGCFSMNKPGASRCRVCGRKLTESRAKVSTRPVLLERAMSGEIFTAVIGRPAAGEAGIRDVRRDRDALRGEDATVRAYRQILGEYEERLRASEEVRRALEAYAKGTRRRRRKMEPEDVEGSIAAAMDAFRARDFDDVVEDLETLVQKHDADPRAWILLGEAHLKREKAADAAASFHRALAVNPKSDRGWLGLAKALRSLEDYEGALGGIDQALEINPNLVEGWTERGVILETLQNLAEALRSFAKVLELRPAHPFALARREAIEAQLAARARSAGAATGEAETESLATAPEPFPPEAAKAETDIDEILGLKDLGPAPPTDSGHATTKEEAEPSPTVVVTRPAAPLPRPARLRTYIEGLDEVLGGGIPWGHVVLIQGTPGTMKSSLGFSILLHNANREGRHGLYLSLEERADSLLRQMGAMGVDLNVAQGSLVLLDPKTAGDLLSERRDWIASLQRGVEAIKKEKGLDLVVVDSLEALEVLARFQDRRREMFRLFEWLRDLGVTSFVIGERPDLVIGGNVLQGRWDEDFLADGVIQLRLHMVSDLEVQRRLRVMKMRGTRHETGYLALVVDEGQFQVTRALSP